MKVCPNCSSVMDDNANICTQCGYQFDAAPSSSGVDLNQQAGSSANERTKYCQNCGTANTFSSTVCSNCGSSTFSSSPKIVTRPTGITILAILGILGSIPELFIGSLFLGIIPIFGILILLFGILFLIASISLFSGKEWARVLAMIFSVLMLIDIPVGTILGIIFLYYFTRPHVKQYFQRQNLNPL
ncbi:MAG: zinc ribbon domain-containing protein [Cuniculiplasma sp.]|nr:zinc ribbon domain-containing protein [Cuniculiplasma sp.]